MTKRKSVRQALSGLRDRHQDTFLRLVFAFVALYIVVSAFEVKWAPLSENFLALVTIGILYLFFELALERPSRDRSSSERMLWNDAANVAWNAMRNGSTIEIISSSSATFYYRLYERVMQLADLRLRIIMRVSEDGDDSHNNKLTELMHHWQTAVKAHGGQVEFRFSTESAVRAIRVDGVTILGFYEWDESLDQYVGHTVPMIVSRGDTDQSAFFQGLFEYLWREGTTPPPVVASAVKRSRLAHE